MTALLAGGALFALGVLGVLVRRDVAGIVAGVTAAIAGGGVTAAAGSAHGAAALAILAATVAVTVMVLGRAVAARLGADRADELDTSRW